MIDAVDSVANTMTNILYKRELLKAKEEIAKGVPLSEPLEKWRTLSTDGSTYDGDWRRDRRDRGNVR